MSEGGKSSVLACTPLLSNLIISLVSGNDRHITTNVYIIPIENNVLGGKPSGCERDRAQSTTVYYRIVQENVIIH